MIIDVVTMALQMSPVDAHPENHQPLCNFQPEAGAASAILNSGQQVELSQCQLSMECSSSEQVPLPIKQNPVPPSPREVEQRVPVRLVNEGATVVAGEEQVLLMMTSGEERCQGPEDGDIRGGAASDFAVLSSDVSQLSVIVSSTVDAQADLSGLASTNQEGTHESTPCNPPSRQVDKAEVDSVAASSSLSNSLNDAQMDVTLRLKSFNQSSTSTFSGETNPPSATYDAVSSYSSFNKLPAQNATTTTAAIGVDYCDSNEPLIVESERGGSSSTGGRTTLKYYPLSGPASNRFWGIPRGAGLRGGAGDNNGASSWGHAPATGWGGSSGGGTNNAASQVQGQWGSSGASSAAASSAANQRSSAASQGPPGSGPPPGASSSGSSQPQGAWDMSKTVGASSANNPPSGTSPSQNVWAAQAAKNVPNQAANPIQDIIAAPLNLSQGGGGSGGAPGSSGPATPSSGKPDPLANYRDVIYSQDGWGGNQVNQDTQWDVPTSPEPKDIPMWKQTASNGTEVWEVNLRNGGQAPPPVPQTKAPWGSHTPATNLGGTWGEDDESAEPSSMWTGVPSNSNNNGPTNWGGTNPLAGPLNAGGPSSVPVPGNMSVPVGMTPSGNGMWGGPKKEPEWAGAGVGGGAGGSGSVMQSAPGGWGDVRPTQRMGIAGMGPGPNENMPMSGPTGPSHWPGPQNKSVAPQWSGSGGMNMQSAPKEMKPSGWDEHSPPTQKRPVHNYDDGTAVWGNPSQMQQGGGGGGGSAVCRWKDMPNPNNVTGGGGRGMQQSGPPPVRGMPPGGMKTDGGMSWGQNRNGSWGEDAGGGGMNAMWTDDSNKMVGGGGSWNEPPQTPTPWGASGPKPKTPTTPSWGGGVESDELSWGQPPKQQQSGMKPLSKEMIWSSKQFRILSDMGFKKEDVENVLRNCNMVMEDALEMLRSGRMGMFGDDHVGLGGGSGSNYGDSMGPHGGGTSYAPPSARFNPGQQMPFVHPGGGGGMNHLLNNPASGMGGMNPNAAYKILQPQQPPPIPPQVNQPQMVRNISRVDSNAGSGGSQPSPTQLRILVQQIQMAVQAGHLNPQILNQPLAPQTLVLLNQLLQQIKVLQQLGQQHTMALSRPGQGGPLLQIVPQMNKTKQQIASLQQQIASQQAIYVKQQQGQMMNQQPPGAPPGQPSDLFKVDAVHNIQANLDRMNLQDPAGQSRLSQWKYPPMDKDGLGDLGGMSDFSRAPGGGGGAPGSLPGNSKPPLGGSLSSPNPMALGQDGGAWSLGRSQSETGWPDSGPEGGTGGGNDGVKESWNSGSAGGSSSYAGSISDLVPEFEPGKPWKGPQIKTAEDDPTLTPGTLYTSGLSNESDVYSSSGSKAGGTNSSTKASPPPSSGGGGSSGGGDTGFPTLGLSNSTWSFNPSSASNAAPSTGSTPYSTTMKMTPKSTWSDAPPPSADPWVTANKPRGPPPGITTAAGPKGNASSVGGRDWSSGATGNRSPWPGSAAGSGGSWPGSLNGSSSWLVLRNLTPQIDGSTLKTLCVQHGPLHNFHLYLSHGVALVRYSTGEEASKAQSALNNCVLGNTTIYADLANESDVQGWLQQLGMPAQQQQQQQQQQQPSSWGVRGSTPGPGGNSSNSGGNNGGGNGNNAGKASANSSGDNWGSGGAGGVSGTVSGGPSSSSPWSTGSNSVWSTPALDRDLRATPSSLNASLNSFLPGDLLGNESM